MVDGFCPTGGWCDSGWWVWDLRTLAQFQGSEVSPGLWMDIKNLKNFPISGWT